jgi:hypothetical protein
VLIDVNEAVADNVLTEDVNEAVADNVLAEDVIEL